MAHNLYSTIQAGLSAAHFIFMVLSLSAKGLLHYMGIATAQLWQ